MSEGHIVGLVYLNFAKAVDSINRRFPLAKLKSSGIDGAVKKWIKSHLSKSTAFFLRRPLVLVASTKVQSLDHYFFCYI